MTTAAYSAAAAQPFNKPIEVVKLFFPTGTMMYSQIGKPSLEVQEIFPYLQSVSPISQELDIQEKITSIGNTSIEIKDDDKTLRDIIIAEGTIMNVSVAIYNTFPDISINDAKFEFSGLLTGFSYKENTVTFEAKNNLERLLKEVNPLTAALVIRGTIPIGFDEVDYWPATVNIEKRENYDIYSHQKVFTITFATTIHADIVYNITPTTTLQNIVDYLNNNHGTYIDCSLADGISGSTLAWKLFNESYDLEYDATQTTATEKQTPYINLNGFERTFPSYWGATTLHDPFNLMLEILDSVGYPLAAIDVDSFSYGSTYLTQWMFKRLVEEPTTAFDLLKELCQSVNGFIVEKEGLLTMVLSRPYNPYTDNPKVISIPKENGFSMESNYDQVINRVVVNYGYSGISILSNNRVIITDAKYQNVEIQENSESIADYGQTNELVIDSKWIPNIQIDTTSISPQLMAMFLAKRILSWLRNAPIKITLDMSIESATLDVGDYIQFTSDEVSTAGWTERDFLVIRKEINEKTVNLVIVDCERGKGTVITPNDFPDEYIDGTDEQKRYGGIGSNAEPSIMPNNDVGSLIV